MKKKSVLDLYKMKQEGEKATWITAYEFPFDSFAEQAGLDMILVGDSLGMVVEGFDGTLPVTMDMCIEHCQADPCRPRLRRAGVRSRGSHSPVLRCSRRP